MTADITDLPSLRNIGNPTFRRMLRRANLENRRLPKIDLPAETKGMTFGQILAFRRTRLPRLGKEDPVDAQTP